MSLPDLHGYWKYGDAVVPFRLPLAPVKIVTRGYIARELPPRQLDLNALANQHMRLHRNQSDEMTAKAPQPPPDTKRHEHTIAGNTIQIATSSSIDTSAEHVLTAESPTRDLSTTNVAENEIEEFNYEQAQILTP